MRWPIVAATTAALLLALNTTLFVGAVKKQQQQQLNFQSLFPQWHSYQGKNLKEHSRSVDGYAAATLATANANNTDQTNADTGRGFMAKLIRFSSFFQPTQPPSSNIIIVTAPTTPTTTTTTLITTPTTPATIATVPTVPSVPTTPTAITTIRANTTRHGHITQVVYGRQDNKGAAKQSEQVKNTRPQRRIHRDHLTRNKQKHRRLQKQHISSKRNKSKRIKKQRIQSPTAGGESKQPLQYKNQQHAVTKFPNQNRIANKIDNFVGNTLDNNKVDIANIADNNNANNNLKSTNSRLQHFMNAFRRPPQTPIVYHNH